MDPLLKWTVDKLCRIDLKCYELIDEYRRLSEDERSQMINHHGSYLEWLLQPEMLAQFMFTNGMIQQFVNLVHEALSDTIFPGIQAIGCMKLIEVEGRLLCVKGFASVEFLKVFFQRRNYFSITMESDGNYYVKCNGRILHQPNGTFQTLPDSEVKLLKGLVNEQINFTSFLRAFKMSLPNIRPYLRYTGKTFFDLLIDIRQSVNKTDTEKFNKRLQCIVVTEIARCVRSSAHCSMYYTQMPTAISDTCSEMLMSVNQIRLAIKLYPKMFSAYKDWAQLNDIYEHVAYKMSRERERNSAAHDATNGLNNFFSEVDFAMNNSYRDLLRIILNRIRLLPPSGARKVSEKYCSFYDLFKVTLVLGNLRLLESVVADDAQMRIGRATITIGELWNRQFLQHSLFITLDSLYRLLLCFPNKFAVTGDAGNASQMLVSNVRCSPDLFTASERYLFDRCVSASSLSLASMREADLYTCVRRDLDLDGWQREFIFGCSSSSLLNQALFFRRYILMHPARLKLYDGYVHLVDSESSSAYTTCDSAITSSVVKVGQSQLSEEVALHWKKSQHGNIGLHRDQRMKQCVTATPEVENDDSPTSVSSAKEVGSSMQISIENKNIICEENACHENGLGVPKALSVSEHKNVTKGLGTLEPNRLADPSASARQVHASNTCQGDIEANKISFESLQELYLNKAKLQLKIKELEIAHSSNINTADVKRNQTGNTDEIAKCSKRKHRRALPSSDSDCERTTKRKRYNRDITDTSEDTAVLTNHTEKLEKSLSSDAEVSHNCEHLVCSDYAGKAHCLFTVDTTDANVSTYQTSAKRDCELNKTTNKNNRTMKDRDEIARKNQQRYDGKEKQRNSEKFTLSTEIADKIHGVNVDLTHIISLLPAGIVEEIVRSRLIRCKNKRESLKTIIDFVFSEIFSEKQMRLLDNLPKVKATGHAKFMKSLRASDLFQWFRWGEEGCEVALAGTMQTTHLHGTNSPITVDVDTTSSIIISGLAVVIADTDKEAASRIEYLTGVSCSRLTTHIKSVLALKTKPVSLDFLSTTTREHFKMELKPSATSAPTSSVTSHGVVLASQLVYSIHRDPGLYLNALERSVFLLDESFTNMRTNLDHIFNVSQIGHIQKSIITIVQDNQSVRGVTLEEVLAQVTEDCRAANISGIKQTPLDLLCRCLIITSDQVAFNCWGRICKHQPSIMATDMRKRSNRTTPKSLSSSDVGDRETEQPLQKIATGAAVRASVQQSSSTSKCSHDEIVSSPPPAHDRTDPAPDFESEIENNDNRQATQGQVSQSTNPLVRTNAVDGNAQCNGAAQRKTAYADGTVVETKSGNITTNVLIKSTNSTSLRSQLHDHPNGVATIMDTEEGGYQQSKARAFVDPISVPESIVVSATMVYQNGFKPNNAVCYGSVEADKPSKCNPPQLSQENHLPSTADIVVPCDNNKPDKSMPKPSTKSVTNPYKLSLANEPKHSRNHKEKPLEKFARSYLASTDFRAPTDELISAARKTMKTLFLTSSPLAFEAYFRDCIGSFGDNLCFGNKYGGPGVTWTYCKPPAEATRPKVRCSNFRKMPGFEAISQVTEICHGYLLAQPNDTRAKLTDLMSAVHHRLSSDRLQALGLISPDQVLPACRNLVLIACIRNINRFQFSKTDPVISLRHSSEGILNAKNRLSKFDSLNKHKVLYAKFQKSGVGHALSKNVKMHQSHVKVPEVNVCDRKSKVCDHNLKLIHVQSTVTDKSGINHPLLQNVALNHSTTQTTGTNNRELISRRTSSESRDPRLNRVLQTAVVNDLASHKDTAQALQSCKNQQSQPKKGAVQRPQQSTPEACTPARLEPVAPRLSSSSSTVSGTLPLRSDKGCIEKSRYVRAIQWIANFIRNHGPCTLQGLRREWSHKAEPELVKQFGTGVSFAVSLQKLGKLFPSDERGLIHVNSDAIPTYAPCVRARD